MALSNTSSPGPAGQRAFWTPGRVGLTFAGVVLISALGVSSCNSGEVVTNKTLPANSAANSASPSAPSPPAFVNLPSDVREAKLQTLDGSSLKLSDYADKVIVLN